jgi:acetolactate synthase-1/2/3 large subunit
VHVDISPESIGKNYETEVAVAADLRRALRELIDAFDGERVWEAATIRERHDEWLQPFAAEFDSEEFPLRPERMVAGANDVLDDTAIIVSDPGTSCPYFAALYEFSEPGRHWITPRAHGALGYALPGIIGAHFAAPDRQVVGFTGDGSAGMSLGELESLSRNDVDATLVVVNNGAYSWIEAGQRNFDDFSFAVDFASTDYAAVAEEFDVAGYRVESADEYRETLADAVAHDGPSLVDLPTRPLPTIDNVPVGWLEPDE